MKKLILLIGCLTLTVACQSAVSTPATESTPTATLRPTPIPATTAPTATPPPSPLPLYFTEEFDTDSTFWEFLQTGGADTPLTAYENGMLRIDISAPHTWYLGIHNAHTYSNILITAKSSATPTGSIGLVCRYDESKGWFEFNTASDGTYSALFGQWLAPGIAQYTPIATDPTKHLEAGNLNYEIGLSCQDNSLLLYVNGTLIRRLDIERFELSEGNVGLTTASFNETPMTAFFEWIKVDEP
ncbi:MAG: hypothetical protein Q8L41_16490 [Anaerolineales bacterium]|nr:hypothetical protein [Anaerolineales bacterium]MDP2777144.1 hypothetical protein [Anaerolineales bacterium]